MMIEKKSSNTLKIYTLIGSHEVIFNSKIVDFIYNKKLILVKLNNDKIVVVNKKGIKVANFESKDNKKIKKLYLNNLEKKNKLCIQIQEDSAFHEYELDEDSLKLVRML